MINNLKEKAISKGMQLLQSKMVTKVMESEQVGVIIEKAMSLPIQVSEQIRTKKEKVTSFMEVATQEEIEELKRTVSKLEEELRTLKKGIDK